jgi:hypothetical protein
MTENKTPKTPAPEKHKPAPIRRVPSMEELATRGRAVSEVAEKQRIKHREEQQAAWRVELQEKKFQTMAPVFVDMRRELERLRLQGDLTETNRTQAIRIDHWAGEYQENFRLWSSIRGNLDKLMVSLGSRSFEQLLETLRETRPSAVPAVEKTRGKLELIESELQRIGIQALDEKERLDEEVQSNRMEDRTLQDILRQVVRRLDPKERKRVLEELRALSRLTLEERLPKLKILYQDVRHILEKPLL